MESEILGASGGGQEASEAAKVNTGQTNETAELLRVTQELGRALQSFHSRSEQTMMIRSAVQEVKEAAKTLSPTLAGLGGVVVNPDGTRGCGCEDECSSCNCLSSKCCEFDIILAQIRVIQMQLPVDPLDTSLNPWGEMEIRIFASIDGLGAMIPDPFSYLSLRKQITDPYGLWHSIHRRIGTVSVCKGTPKTILVSADVTEVEVGLLETVGGNRDEYGSDSASMTLDCCCTPTTEVRFNVKLTGGGQGQGEVELKFIAQRK